MQPVAEIGSPACSHCGLDVPLGLIREEDETQFCCSGCRAAYDFIHLAGMDFYYSLRDKQIAETSKVKPVSDLDSSFQHFDDESFTEKYVRTKESEGSTRCSTSLYLEGVHCAACVWLIEQLPSILPGVAKSSLEFSRSRAQISWDPKQTSLSKIANTLARLSYKPHPFRGVDRAQLRKKEERKLLARIGVAAAGGGNVMLLAICLYAGDFYGIEQKFWSLFRWLSLVLTLPTVLFSASVFFKGALSALRAKKLHIDLPISLGIALAFVASCLHTIQGSGEIYFDSISVLILLLLSGRWLQFRSQLEANERSEVLYALLPTAAHKKLADGSFEDVPIESIRRGDILAIFPNETVPVDGTLNSSSISMNLSALTGESKPISLGKGDKICAGFVNLDTPAELEVTATGEDTRLGKLTKLVEDTFHSKPQIVQMADKISGHFVVAVLTLSSVAFYLGSLSSLEEGFSRALALLVVSCPCALGLATPLAIAVALSKAAKAGIFIKNADSLEVIGKAKTIVLDKTGTVTSGAFELLAWAGDTSLKPIVRELENHSTHAIARALVRSLSYEHYSGAPLSNIREQLGKGIQGTSEDGIINVGSLRYMQELNIELNQSLLSEANSRVEIAQTPIFIAKNGSLAAVAIIGDPLQDGAKKTIAQLSASGKDLFLLSGDDQAVVSRVGKSLNIPAAHCIGQQSPEDKLKFIENLENRPVIMCGDGVNDAAALGRAEVGVAVHGSVEASVIVSDVFFAEPSASQISNLISGALKARNTIHRSLAISLVYNTIGATLALLGLIGPLFAAVLMPLSSLTVIMSSLWQNSFEAGEAKSRH